MPRRAALALTIAASLWVAALLAGPVALGRRPTLLPAALLYAGAGRVCHQRPERSFHLAGAQQPVCARCFGLYVSGAAGAWLAWASARRPGRHARTWLAAAALPTAATWLLEAAGTSSFSNGARFVAALPLGAVAGWVFVQMLRYDFLLDGHQVDDGGPRVHSR